MIPGSPYYNPDPEYGRSLLDSPHKVVIAPTFCCPSAREEVLSSSQIGDALLGGWSITRWSTLQSGFPMGVSQNVDTAPVPVRRHAAAEPGRRARTSSPPGDITDRIRRTRPTTCTSTWRRSRRRRRTSSATRRARCPASLAVAQHVDLSVSKNVRPAAARVGPPGSAEHVQHRPVGGAGELGVRQLVVRPDQQSGEQHADDAVHAQLRFLTRSGRSEWGPSL